MNYLYLIFGTVWAAITTWLHVAHQKLRKRVKQLEYEKLAKKVADDEMSLKIQLDDMSTDELIEHMDKRKGKRNSNKIRR